MESFELLLVTLFVVVIFMSVQGLPRENLLGTASLVFVMLWIGWDNVGEWDNKGFIDRLLDKVGLRRSADKQQHEYTHNVEKKKSNVGGDITDKELTQKIEALLNKTPDTKSNIPVPKPMSERPEGLIYSEGNYKDNMFSELGGKGDNELSQRMKFMSNQARVSIDNQARVNKYTNIGYIKEELDNHAASRWWDDETLEEEF
jgi:hypothetical protein